MRKSAIINHAFLHNLPIEVWMDGELICTGLIQRHTLRDIVIDGMHYFKHAFEFRIRSEHHGEL
jgi:hypothetical protein